MDINDQPFKGEYVSYAHYGNTGQIRVAQLAPQYQLLPQNESRSSIPRSVKWTPPHVHGVASSYPSSITFGEENNSGSVLYHEFVNARFIGQ
jgi:hypothetical protein